MPSRSVSFTTGKRLLFRLLLVMYLMSVGLFVLIAWSLSSMGLFVLAINKLSSVGLSVLAAWNLSSVGLFLLAPGIFRQWDYSF